MKNFDRIDIIFIVLISIYLLALFIMISWIILTKLENKSIAKKGKSILSAKEKKLPPKNKVQAKKVNESKNNYRSKGYVSPNKRKKKNR